MIGIVQGVVGKSGSGEYGNWFVLKEGPIQKRDGGEFYLSHMCSTKSEAPYEGARVVAQGYVRAKVDENNGKHYANISLSACSYTMLEQNDDVVTLPSEGDDTSEIPF